MVFAKIAYGSGSRTLSLKGTQRKNNGNGKTISCIGITSNANTLLEDIAGGKEFETSAKIKEGLTKYSVEWRSSSLETGVWATVKGGKPILLRADMDALLSSVIRYSQAAFDHNSV